MRSGLQTTFNHSGSNTVVFLDGLRRRPMCALRLLPRIYLFGIYALMCSRGAQVGVASFAVNFLVDQNIGINASKASQLLSFCQLTFTIGRYVPFQECLHSMPIDHHFQIRWSCHIELYRPSIAALGLRRLLFCFCPWRFTSGR